MNGTIHRPKLTVRKVNFNSPLHFYKVIGATFVWVRAKRKQPRMPLVPLSYIAKKIFRNQHHTVATSVDYGF